MGINAIRNLTVVLIGITVLGCGPAEEPAERVSEPTFAFRVLATGLESPWEITWGPDDRLWVTERVGKRVTRVNPADGSRRVALELPEAYQEVGQDGVLGMALDAGLLQGTGNDYVYVVWTYDQDPEEEVDVRTKIERYTFDPATETLGEATEVIAGLPAHDDHLGGRLVYGPDAKLYLSIGDQGSNWLQNLCNPNLAQVLPTAGEIASGDWTRYAGKILRINPDGSIPDDNPTLDGVQSHIYSYGHRNPQGLVFDVHGNFYEAEHGPSTDDEINRIEAGGNYGWPHVAGYQDDQAYAYANWSASAPTPCPQLEGGGPPPDSVPVEAETDWSDPGFIGPIETLFTVGNDYDFQSMGSATVAPAGLDVYTSTTGIPGWVDSLMLASLTQGAVYRMALSVNHQLVVGGPVQLFKTTNRYRDLAIHPDGRVFYIITDNAGRTTNAAGESTRELANPGTILEFMYLEDAG